MPGPLIKPMQLPDWADPAQTSVMDPLYKALARRASSALGLDDPASQVMQAAMPAPLVSIYRNPAARQAATGIFREAANALPINLKTALNEFADKYPRVAAHISPQAVGKQDVAAAFVDTPKGKVVAPLRMGFTKLGRSITHEFDENGLNTAKRLVNHEGTHVAQSLGNSDMQRLYSLANKLKGYDFNPFEESAERAAQMAVDPGMNMPYKNAISSLIDSAQQAVRGEATLSTPSVRASQAPWDNAKKVGKSILDLLADRASR